MRLGRLSSLLAPIRLRYLFLITVALGLIFFALTYLGISKARQSLLKIMVDEGKALIQSLALSSNNAIQSGLLLESLSEESYLDLAENALRKLGRQSDPQDYRLFCQDNGLISLDILDTSLSIVTSDRWAVGFTPEYPDEVQAEILDILRQGGGYRSILYYGDDDAPVVQYFIYIFAPDESSDAAEGIMVMASEAVYLDQIMQQIGIGYLIREISGQAGIEYIFLQSRDGIVFSSMSLPPVLKIENDSFLDSLMAADTIGWRLHMFEDREVLEVARRFESVSYPPGIYRIGLNLQDFQEISRGYDRQIIVFAVVLFLLSLLVVAVVSVNQNYFILDKSFRQMRSMSETIFDRLTSGVLAYDGDGAVIAVNSAFTELTGVGIKAVGTPVREYAEKLPFELPERLEPDRPVVSFETRVVTPAGEERTILLGASALPDAAGGGTVVLIHDISERKRLEEQNRRRERLSEMGDMAAGVAHEIRNPLNAIGIAAQRLQAEFVPPEEADEYGTLTGNILSETERLNQILTRFLELAKSRASEERPIDLGQAVEKGIGSLTDEARQRNIAIEYRPHDTVMVRGDLERLQQVFINLIKNSIQAAARDGSVTITIDADDDSSVSILVADSGPGFPEDSLPKIFQPYFTTKADGSGLGLALAYKTINDCGGRIEAYNAEDGGAVVRITLPRI